MQAPNNGPTYDPKNLQVIFFALLAAQIIFLFYALLSLEETQFIYHIDDISFTLIPLIALAADIIGNRIFNRQILDLGSLDDMQKALQKLAKAYLIQWMLVETATLLLIIYTLISVNHFFSLFALANIIYFITLRPRLFTFNEGLQ
jgi:hypothetical protein